MNILSWFISSWPRMSVDDPVDLESWRIWFSKIAVILGVIFLPVGIAVSFPVFIADQDHLLIIFDICVWLILTTRLFSKANSYKLNTYIFFILLYTMMIYFFIELGPTHARSAWLITCAVIAALMFGIRGAIISTVLNIIILITLYWMLGPENDAWAAEYSASFSKWLMFIVNVSLLTLASSLSVGFMLNRLDRSLKHERAVQQRLAEESEKLRAANISLGQEIEQRKQAEKERSRLEDQLGRAQKMEAIGTLAGGIAHDFNNILMAIIGFTELALMDAGKGTNQEKHLHAVRKAGSRAKDLVKQILTFSRYSEQELRPLQLKTVVNEVMKLIRATLPSTIQIKQDIRSDSTILADPVQVHQVLMNLCTNAGHAMMKDGGILDVSLGDVELDIAFLKDHPGIIPGRYMKLTVRDTGHGISPEILDRIYDPYFTTKPHGEGTGLGLSVVHGIVKSYKGLIMVMSEPGKGTTFDIFLPVMGIDLTSDERPDEPLPSGKGHILFVDDEPALAEVGTYMLETLGYEVAAKTSSVEALELFKAQPEKFDLVVTDMTMPVMTGETLAGEIMKVRADIPVILCTGFSHQINKQKAMQLGIRAFIMKPFVLRDIGIAVREALGKH